MTNQDFIVHLLLWTCVCSARNVRYDCPPSELGHSYVLKFILPYNDTDPSTKIVVQRGKWLIATCRLFDGCKDYTPKLFKTKWTSNNGTFENEIEITIFNVSWADQQQWHLMHSRHLFTCDVKVFARAKTILCEETLSNEMLHVTCWTSKVYPAVKSIISFSLQNVFKIIIFNRTMICVNEEVKTYPAYYNTVCDLTLPVNDFDPGVYEALVTMYPNVTGSDMDMYFGTNTAFHINLELPLVTLRDCPKIVIENTQVTCDCARSVSSRIDASVVWSPVNNSSDMVFSKGSQVLIFNAQRPRRDFFCKVVFSFGFERRNVSLLYSPIIISRIDNLTCAIDHLGIDFVIKCEADRFFPAALCQYVIIYNTTTLKHSLTDRILYDNFVMAHDPVYYKSTCIIMISHKRMEASLELYEILVEMFPNITGTDNDKQYGETKVVNIKSKHSGNNKSDQNILVSVPKLITLFFGLSMLICLIAATFWCLKQKDPHHMLNVCSTCIENKKKSHDYDEPNDGYIVSVNTIYQGDEQFDSTAYRTIDFHMQSTNNEPETNVEKHEYESIRDDVLAEIQQFDNPNHDNIV